MTRRAHPWSPHRLYDATPQMHAAYSRVTFAHYMAMRRAGIPPQDLVADGQLTFGVCRVAGREMVVTDWPRLQAYLTGPVIAAFPGATHGEG